MANQKNIQVDSLINEINAKYQKNGLTYISNISTVNKRDAAGNIEFVEGAQNPLVIIEPVSTKITTKSVIKILDTQFNYFKFPARTTIIEEEPLELDLDIDLNIQDQINEAIAAEVTPPLPSQYKPSSNQRIPLGSWSNPSILDFSNVVEGPNQIKPNSLVITQQLLDQLEALRTETNTPVLRITGVIKTNYNAERKSAIGFSIGYANGASRFVMSQPEGDLKITDAANNIVKAQKDGVYTTIINTSLTLDQIYIDQEIQIRGWSEDDNDNRNHTILANDSYIKFEAGVQ